MYFIAASYFLIAKSAASKIWRIWITSPGSAGQRCAHSRALLSIGLGHPIAAQHFLGFNEGAVGHGRFAFAERDARAGGQRMQASYNQKVWK